MTTSRWSFAPGIEPNKRRTIALPVEHDRPAISLRVARKPAGEAPGRDPSRSYLSVPLGNEDEEGAR
jgi:hypothetical protein